MRPGAAALTISTAAAQAYLARIAALDGKLQCYEHVAADSALAEAAALDQAAARGDGPGAGLFGVPVVPLVCWWLSSVKSMVCDGVGRVVCL